MCSVNGAETTLVMEQVLWIICSLEKTCRTRDCLSCVARDLGDPGHLAVLIETSIEACWYLALYFLAYLCMCIRFRAVESRT